MPRIVLSEDHLQADIVLLPDERTTPQVVNQLLQSTGVTYGLLVGAIAGIAEVVGPATFPVAAGDAAADGVDSRIEPMFGVEEAPRLGRGTGTLVDPFRFMQAGDVLARRLPPIPPRTGRTVLGRLVQPPFPKDELLRAGVGARVTDDGLQVVAVEPGRPYLDGSVFLVRAEKVLRGSAAANLGAGEFDGDVRVIGGVGPGSDLHAKGHILVEGDVTGARLIAGGGIWVLGVARPGAVLEATGDVQVRGLEGARVRSKGTLKVLEDAREADVAVVGEVLVGGTVLGGRIQAGHRSEVRSLGAASGAPTWVMVIPPDHGEQYATLESEQAKLLATMRQLAPKIRAAEAAAAQPDASPAALDGLRKLRDLSELLDRRESALAERKKALGKPAASRRARVDVREQAFPGVSLQLSETAGMLMQMYPAGSFIAEGGTLRFLALG